MRCYICNSTLSPEEIQYRPHDERHKWDACGRCLAEIDEVYDDHLTEEELDELIAWEEETGHFGISDIPD